MKSCCAIGCRNRYSNGSSLSFYRFPVDLDRRCKWIAAIKRKNWEPNQHSFLCSDHFTTGRKSQDPLSPDFVPSVFQYTDSPTRKKTVKAFKKYQNRKTLLRRKIVQEKAERIEEEKRAAEEEKVAEEERVAEKERVAEEERAAQEERAAEDERAAEEERVVEEERAERAAVSVSTQTDFTITGCPIFSQKCLQFTDDGFRNDEAVKFYTSLPSYHRLKSVYDLASGFFTGKHGNSSLTLFQELLLTLMKLRLNLRDQDLSFRFGVCQSTVSRIFRKWIDILYTLHSFKTDC